MTDLTKADLRDRLGNIDQIRDILFGSVLRDYSQRFEQLEANLSVLQQEIRDRTDEVKQVFSTELQAAVDGLEKKIKTLTLKDEEEKGALQQQMEVLNKRIANTAEEVGQAFSAELHTATDNLDKKLKTFSLKDDEEKTDIRQQLDRLSKRLSSNFTSLDETLDRQTNALRDDLLSSREKLQDDILSLRNQIFEEIDKRMSLLTDAKVSREDMAEMLFELGLRLKGTEVVPRLREAVDSAEGGTAYLLSE